MVSFAALTLGILHKVSPLGATAALINNCSFLRCDSGYQGVFEFFLFPFVIPGLIRNPGGYGSNIDLDSGSEAGVTDKKTGRYDRKRKCCAVTGRN